MKKITATIDKESNRTSERGVSLIITLMVMAMLLGFVAMALTRVASEARVASNDSAEARTLAVSEAGLEDATRDFASLLENKISPTDDDLTKIKNEPVDQYTGAFEITKALKPLGVSNLITIQSDEFQGLYSLRDEWQIDVTAREYQSDVKVQTMRRFYNNRIPLFQFGAFFQDDLELNRPPLFALGGKVHTNGNLFVSSSPLNQGGGIFFKSKVTVSGEIVNNIWKTGTTMYPGYDDTGDVFFPDASGNNEQLTVGNGSVNCTSDTGGGVLKDPSNRNFPYPNCTKNPNWLDFASKFEGNLQANTPKLRLPVDRLNVPLIEMIRRGKNIGDKANVGGALTAVDAATKDEETVSKERFANKSGIRVSLADSRDKLPGCAAAAANCGVQLDAKLNTTDLTLGYQPVSMTDNYKTTAVNGNRLAVSGRQTWIKVDMVSFDYDANVPVTTDITQDFLSLGMTEPLNDPNIAIFNYTSNQDSRSIIKIQHFVMQGPALVNPGTPYVSNQTINGKTYNFVSPYSLTVSILDLLGTSPCYSFSDIPGYKNKATCVSNNAFAPPVTNPTLNLAPVSSVETQHYKMVCFNTATNNCNGLIKTNSGSGNAFGNVTCLNCVLNSLAAVLGTTAHLSVPFPIQMYDSREGNRADSNPGTPGYVYRNGVMSLIDIDVANLRQFFAGTWDGKFPTTTPYAQARGGVGLKSTDVPNNRGWVVYVSDRRGDYNFDGRYDMEDTNAGAVSLSEEDLNNNGTIDLDINYEAPAQDQKIDQGLSAVTDHQYYRRGVRLINARQIPGKYDSANPNNSLGFTFASENGIYIKGNYNAQSVALAGGTNVADSNSYLPQNTIDHIPASIVGDSVMVLSNAWNDANSFVNAFDTTKRLAADTQIRFAMITGDSLTARYPGVYGDFGGLNGGLHNIFRFMERWRDKRLNYSGSIVNLYNSYNNNGKWKCCTTVYDPPIRDWTFDSTFTDPNRLPPGAPFVYYITFTGFQRVNP